MLSKMTALHIHLAGFFTALVVAGLLFLLVIKPQQEALTRTKQETNDLLTTQHGDEADQHERDAKKEEQKKVTVLAKWQQASSEYMPAIPFGTDVLQTYEDVIINLPREYGSFMSAWYDAQRKEGISRAVGVGFPIPSFPTNPNDIASLNHITFPSDGNAWNVTVEAKSFDDLMAHLRRFNTDLKHHGVPVINNVSLEGQSPNLLGRYQLALYIIPPTSPPPADPRIGAAAAAAAGGGIGMGRMGGGPPGMMGGPGGFSGPPGMMGPGGYRGMRPGMGGAPAGAPIAAPPAAGGGGKAGKDPGDE